MPDSLDIYLSLDEYFLSENRGGVYDRAITIMEKMLIEKALDKFSGNQIEASRMLGIHRNTLHAKIVKLKIDVEKYKL